MVRTSQVRSNKEIIINSQEKVPDIVKFKSPTFVLSLSKDIVLPKNNHSISPPSNLDFPSFLPKKNLFSLSKTTPLILRMETLLLYLFLLFLPPSKPSPSFPLELPSSLSKSKSSSELKPLLKTLLLSSFTISPSPTAKNTAAVTARNHATTWTCSVVDLGIVWPDTGDAIVLALRFNFYHF